MKELEKIKHQLTKGSYKKRIAALSEAINHGQNGENLIIEIAKTTTGTMQWAAIHLLWQRANKDEKQKLKQYFRLQSDQGVDYTELCELLAASEWKQADLETSLLMLKLTGREKAGYLGDQDINSFPYSDLRTIDKLWELYSEGHFGFSVQKFIYQSLGGTKTYNSQIWREFCQRVGWLVKEIYLSYELLCFDLNAPSGQLPYGWGLTGWGLLTPSSDYSASRWLDGPRYKLMLQCMDCLKVGLTY